MKADTARPSPEAAIAAARARCAGCVEALPLWMKPREVATVLNVSHLQVLTWLAQGKIPYWKIRTRKFVSRSLFAMPDGGATG